MKDWDWLSKRKVLTPLVWGYVESPLIFLYYKKKKKKKKLQYTSHISEIPQVSLIECKYNLVEEHYKPLVLNTIYVKKNIKLWS